MLTDILPTHINEVGATHKANNTFKCLQCAAGFNMKSHLKRHIESVHLGRIHSMTARLTASPKTGGMFGASVTLPAIPCKATVKYIRKNATLPPLLLYSKSFNAHIRLLEQKLHDQTSTIYRTYDSEDNPTYWRGPKGLEGHGPSWNACE
ncbi:hypothetical protein BCR33DRAFT_171716 [Rhizoclosmatium globosum]|uniref:C2H2-type domain-containing protein n=1 Tax=Rhizoclosmatium globosum TaxID=329046 RepID=A0A1Y2CFC5_9FUNG|nr:hypothetical protein BCR33DRAFT_171716 [Rhizoclosmatium globosum]|eukprot:ORY45626.1 hypothetical protein BCR33DRAFT_171716 [Rhizoclosmatium globosum]